MLRSNPAPVDCCGPVPNQPAVSNAIRVLEDCAVLDLGGDKGNLP